MESIEFSDEIARHYAAEFTWFLRELDYLSDGGVEGGKVSGTLREVARIFSEVASEASRHLSEYFVSTMLERLKRKHPELFEEFF
ncbi:MAG: hypothetical protein ACTSU5_20565 [Promethearchaeota archaeon]